MYITLVKVTIFLWIHILLSSMNLFYSFKCLRLSRLFCFQLFAIFSMKNRTDNIGSGKHIFLIKFTFALCLISRVPILLLLVITTLTFDPSHLLELYVIRRMLVVCMVLIFFRQRNILPINLFYSRSTSKNMLLEKRQVDCLEILPNRLKDILCDWFSHGK